jgi:hypothetical protein
VINEANEDLVITTMVLDRAARKIIFRRSDNKEATFPLPATAFSEHGRLVSTAYYPQLSTMTSTTDQGDHIYTELATGLPLAERRNRPVIYLDQKDWSLLANAQHRPELVLPSQIEAARIITDLATKRRIILPISAGHLSETLKWSVDDSRYKLGLTMAQLSGGWQMRDALDVRRFELRQAYARRFGPNEIEQPAVITLEAFALHGSYRGLSVHSADFDLPSDLRLATDSLTSSSLYIDLLLNVESIERGTSPGWVKKNQDFTEWLAGLKQTKAQKLESIHMFFLMDVIKEAAEEAIASGISAEQLREWITHHWTDDLASMPALALFKEVSAGLHMNATRKWTDNDLTDLMYLTCAAAYSDYVVAEKFMASQIRQAQIRLGQRVNVYPRLSEFIADIKDL